MTFDDLDGPQFLSLYLAMALAAAAIAVAARFALRHFLCRPGTESVDDPLDPYEVAWLGGGDERAVQAAVAQLHNDGLLFVAGDSAWATDARPGVRFPIERAVLAGAAGGATISELNSDSRAACEALRDGLIRRGLAVDPLTALAVEWVPAGVMLVPILVALPRFFDRLFSPHPTLFLFFALGGTCWAALSLVQWSSRATLAGARAFDAARTEPPGGRVEAAHSVALMGLAAMPFVVQAMIKPRASGGGGGSADGCGGDSGCGGGCGGCGCY